MTIICLKKSCTFCSILAYIVRIQFLSLEKRLISMHSFSALEINFESYTTLSVACVWFNNYLLFNITAKKNLSYMYCTFRPIWQRNGFFFTCECKYIATCLYLGNRGNLLALWCIYSLYLSPLSIRDTIYVLTISLPIWDTIDVLQNAVFPYHCRTHFVSLQDKQNVQFFKYTTVERMNIYQANEYRIIFIHFCHANLRVWGENTYKEW